MPPTWESASKQGRTPFRILHVRSTSSPSLSYIFIRILFFAVSPYIYRTFTSSPRNSFLILKTIFHYFQLKPMKASNSPKNVHFHTTRVLPEPDLYLHTTGGSRILAHASILVLFLLLLLQFEIVLVTYLIFYYYNCLTILHFFFVHVVLVLISILKASASPVLENIIMSNRIVKIHGVPYDAVTAFLRFLYSSRLVLAKLEKYVITWSNWCNVMK